ncbi:MAG TPA: hypothetical protein PKE64_30185 [Anaerolineae bacterium]|nr:hypothetical protein [Anaerolineae bacterium]HMR68301.1 hypothetical protein [Anaerolineae bacterium]
MEGLLWFDSDPKRKTSDKIIQAADRFRARLKQKPTVCYLNSAEFDETQTEVEGIEVRPGSNILPHHFLLGVEQNSPPSKTA